MSSNIQINQLNKRETASEEVDRLLYAFLFLVLTPLVLIGFVATLLKPEWRAHISDILAVGFFMFIGLLMLYWIIRRAKM